VRDEAETPHYFGMVGSSTSHPTARVEYALRADDLLAEPQVRRVMEYYLAVRLRRAAAAQSASVPTPTVRSARPSLPARMPPGN
jgi:hypothetical protein